MRKFEGREPVRLLMSCLLELNLGDIEVGFSTPALPNGWHWINPEVYDYATEMEICIENAQLGVRHFRRWRKVESRDKLLGLIDELVSMANLK